MTVKWEVEQDGPVISMIGTFTGEDPIYGVCHWEDCEQKAVFENLMNVQLCNEHFQEY